jgi:hypothetical protein
MQRKKLYAAILVILLMGGTAFYFYKKSGRLARKPSPELTVEQILAEREHQASKQLDTPLGKALVNRNWVEVATLYHPQSDFITLGEIIRALFIENKIKDYTPEDHEKLLGLVISTFAQMPEKNLHLAGMLVTQFNRLPAPAHTSENFAALKHWASDPNETALKRRLGITKLVLHDAEPDPEPVALFQKSLIAGDTFGQTRADWIQHVDEIRNHALQVAALDNLSKNFHHITTNAQGSALTVLAHHLDQHPDETKTLTLQFLKSQSLDEFESALRALPPLIKGNHFKQAEKEALVKKMTNIPTPLRTPFTQFKSTEILKLLGHT